MRFVFVAVVFVLLSGVSGAQEALPVAPENVVKDLTIATVSIENTSLKIALLQRQLVEQRAQLNQLLTSLQKPGYSFDRTADGNWVYTPNPK